MARPVNKETRCNRCAKPTTSVSDSGLVYLCPECGGRAIGSAGSLARERAAKAAEVPPELADTGRWIEANAWRLDLPDGTLWESLTFTERCRRILDLRKFAIRERNAEVAGTLETAALGMIQRERQAVLARPESGVDGSIERIDAFSREVWRELRSYRAEMTVDKPKDPPRAEASRLAGRNPSGDAAASEAVFDRLRESVAGLGGAMADASISAAEAAGDLANAFRTVEWRESYGAVRRMISEAQSRGEARVGKLPQGTVDRMAAEAKMRLDEQRAKVEQAERSVEAYGRRRRGRTVGGRSSMETEERIELEAALARERNTLANMTREAVRDGRAVPVVISRAVVNDSKRRLVIAFTYSDGTEVKIPADPEFGRSDTFAETLADRSPAEVLAVGAFIGERAGFNLGTRSEETREFWTTAMVDARRIRDRWKAAGVGYRKLGANIAAGLPITDAKGVPTSEAVRAMLYPGDPDPSLETVNVRNTIANGLDWTPQEYGAVEEIGRAEILNPDAGPRVVRGTSLDFSRENLGYKVRMEYGGAYVGDRDDRRGGSRAKVAPELPAVIQQRKIDLPE